jgi:chromosomal replication initiator protein
LNANQIWQAALSDLKKITSTPDYNTWLKSTSIVSFTDEGLVTIKVPNTFAKEWIEGRLADQITAALSNIVGRPVILQCRVGDEPELLPLSGQTAQTAGDELPVPTLIKTPDDGRHEGYGPSTLNPRYVFERFIVGSSNRLAYAASRAVAENPAHAYNPLFLYGGVGLGKTHLLHAIAQEALRLQRGLTVLYVSSEKFTNDLINAIRDRKQDDFRNRYRTIDILLIDDIQFIAGKESTQEEFFHTFNTLHESNKQIVLSSDRPPKAMTTLEDRLRSRFEGGLIADVQAPDLETRIAILRTKAEQQKGHVPGDVIEYLARKIQTNIRELEGSLTRVIAFASFKGSPITIDIANEALNDVMLNTRRRLITPSRIIQSVCTYFSIGQPEITGRSRNQEVVMPRQIAMFIIREQTDTSLTEIGNWLGGRDHTTVMHGCGKIEKGIDSDPQLRQDVLTIKELLYSDSGR